MSFEKFTPIAVAFTAVLAVACGAPTEEIAVDGDEYAVAEADLLSAAGTVVVANRNAGNVSLIDVRTNAVTTIDLPAGSEGTPEPMYVSYVPRYNRVFVNDRRNQQIVVYRAHDFSQESIIPVGVATFHQWGSRWGRQLWLCNDADASMTVIDTRNLAVVATVAVPADLAADGATCHDVVVDARGRNAFVTMIRVPGTDDVVVKFNTRTFAEAGRVTVGDDPHLAISTFSRNVFVASQEGSVANGGTVLALRQRNLAEAGRASVPNAHGISFSAFGRHVYVTNISGGGTDALFKLRSSNAGQVGAPASTNFAVPHNVIATSNNKAYIAHSGGTATQVSFFDGGRGNNGPTLDGDTNTDLNPFGIGWVPFAY